MAVFSRMKVHVEKALACSVQANGNISLPSSGLVGTYSILNPIVQMQAPIFHFLFQLFQLLHGEPGHPVTDATWKNQRQKISS